MFLRQKACFGQASNWASTLVSCRDSSLKLNEPLKDLELLTLAFLARSLSETSIVHLDLKHSTAMLSNKVVQQDLAVDIFSMMQVLEMHLLNILISLFTPPL